MTLYEYFCSECEVLTWTEYEAPTKERMPHCCNCGDDASTELTGYVIEDKEETE